MTEDKDKKTKIKSQGKKTPKRITETYLHNSGLYYLQRYASSVENFRRVMGQKIEKSCHFHHDHDREEYFLLLERLIRKFEDVGLLNDVVYARGVVQSMYRQGKSRKAIEGKFYEKGISKEIAQKSLHDFYETQDINEKDADLEAAHVFARKKRLGPYKKEGHITPDDYDAYRDKQKQMARFARAGFSFEVAQRVLSDS